MKKILVEKVREEAKYFCDKHPDRECFTKVVTTCWYGSRFDMDTLKINLCDECMEEFYKLVKENFGVEPKEDENIFCGECPCCERK